MERNSFCVENPWVIASQVNAFSIHLAFPAEAPGLEQQGCIWKVPMQAVASK